MKHTTDLIRRIGIFMIGIALGIVLLSFFFKGKGVEICYFPNCRVLKDIRNKPVSVDTLIQKQGYNIEILKPIFWNGDVDFSRSQTRMIPCKTYTIIGISSDEQTLEITVENCPQKAIVTHVKKLN